jgi:glycosyltransferase involved in cell wall biosynthesis/predicted amidohydrolase
LKVGIAQINPTVGDLESNIETLRKYIYEAKERDADLIVFPELSVTGYPPQDLLLQPDFVKKNKELLVDLISQNRHISGVIGFVDYAKGSLYNSAAVFEGSRIIDVVHKTSLPTYDVFDEDRYFETAGARRVKPVSVTIAQSQIKLGIEICEDLWDEAYDTKVTDLLARAGSDMIINISASPFYVGKRFERERLLRTKATANNIPIFYVNMVGGQDELVFDGGDRARCAAKGGVGLNGTRANTKQHYLQRWETQSEGLQGRGSVRGRWTITLQSSQNGERTLKKGYISGGLSEQRKIRMPEELSVNICLVLISDYWGGAEAVVYELARHLKEKGHNVTVFVNREILSFYRDLDKLVVFDLGHLYPFTSMAASKVALNSKYDLFYRFISLLCDYLDELYRTLYYVKIRTCMMNFILENGIEIVHSHLGHADFLVSGIPRTVVSTVATVHGDRSWMGIRSLTVPTSLTGPLVKWREHMFRSALTRVGMVTAVSTFTLRALSAWEPQLKHKTVVIVNGVSVPDIQATRKSDLIPKESFNLLFPGGTRTPKGGALVIRALALVTKEIPFAHIYIAGDVPSKHPLREIVRQMRLESNTTFTGFLPVQQYRNLLKSVDLLVMPSFEEAFGLAYLEAMALGKPIIAGKTGGVQELVRDGRNGILVDLDAEHIASAILQLYRNRDLAQAISQSNLRDVMRFDWRSVVDQYIELYRGLSKSQ